MNSHLLRKAFRQQYRKYALRISVGVHLLLLIILAFFFLRSQVTEIEDEIQVELISEMPRQNIVKKKALPIPKKETPKSKEEIPIPREERTLQKKQTVVQPKQSVAIAKMSPAAPKRIDIDEPAPERIDVDAPALLETPDLSTDADLTPTPESILSPIPSDTGDTPGKSYGRREGTSARKPGKGTGTGLDNHIKGTSTQAGDSIRNYDAGIGGSESFSSIIKQLADDIIQTSGGAPIDVVFIVDASGSMGDNINAVAEHLVQMIDAYKASEIDYQLGLTQFSMNRNGNNNISVFQPTTSLAEYKQALFAIVPRGDENALDAIDQTLNEMKFRKNAVKHLILLTDEPFTSQKGLSVDHAVTRCQQNEIFVNVLGENIPEHRRLAADTGGTWHAIPQDPKQQNAPINKPRTTQTIGNAILTDGANTPVDIILFIDSSKSMADKIPYLTQQIDMWIRNWKNASIKYRIGAVRFRADQSVNMATVFKPPQTQAQLHKILQLPCQNDENLLHAVVDATRRLKIRADAKTHFILITDEPGDPKTPIAGTIQFLKEIPVVVSVIGTSDNFQQQVTLQTGGIWMAMPNGHKINEPYH